MWPRQGQDKDKWQPAECAHAKCQLENFNFFHQASKILALAKFQFPSLVIQSKCDRWSLILTSFCSHQHYLSAKQSKTSWELQNLWRHTPREAAPNIHAHQCWCWRGLKVNSADKICKCSGLKWPLPCKSLLNTYLWLPISFLLFEYRVQKHSIYYSLEVSNSS